MIIVPLATRPKTGLKPAMPEASTLELAARTYAFELLVEEAQEPVSVAVEVFAGMISGRPSHRAVARFHAKEPGRYVERADLEPFFGYPEVHGRFYTTARVAWECNTKSRFGVTARLT